MSPEQADSKPLDQRADVYSIGCILYEMLTGNPPIMGKTAMEVMRKQTTELPLPLSQAALKKFPIGLERIVSRALEKNPDDRFSSADELLEAIQNFQHGIEELAPKRNNEAKPKTKVDKATLVLLTGAALAAITVVTFIVLNLSQSKSPQLEAKATSESTKPEIASIAKESSTTESLLPNSANIDFANLLANDPKASILKVPDDCLDITDEALDGLKDQPQLGQLDIHGCSKITSAGFNKLAALPNLYYLNLSFTNFGDDDIALINRMRHLYHIDLNSSKITDRGILKLRPDYGADLEKQSAHQLKLVLKNTKISDKSLAYLAEIGYIDGLELDSCSEITDSGIESLSRLTDFTHLDLAKTRISNKAVGSILKMRNLASLSLNSTDIDDEALNQLAKARSLRKLYIRNCSRLSANAIANFKKLSPECQVFH
jgi:hypothetical protein